MYWRATVAALLGAVVLHGAGDAAAQPPHQANVHVDLASHHDIPKGFLGFGWEMFSFLEYARAGALADPLVIQLSRNLAPAVLRVGGITADFVTYQLPTSRHGGASAPKTVPGASSAHGHPSDLPSTNGRERLGGFWPDYEKPLSWANFTALVHFASTVGWDLVFDLNELHGRNCHVNGTTHCEGEWDTSNLHAFLSYIHAHNIGPIRAFELGNELTRSHHIEMVQNIADHLRLLDIVDEIWGKENAPPVVGPSTDLCDETFEQFLNDTFGRLHAVTYHSYPGGNGDHNATDLVNATWLRDNIILHDQHANSSNCIAMFAAAQKRHPTGLQTALWLTETDYSYAGVSAMQDFENAFWYLASAGQYAVSGATLHARWSFFGYGGFSIIKPNHTIAADYWVAASFKHFVGTRAFEVTAAPDSPALVYAYCMKGNPGSLLLSTVNPGPDEVTLTVDGLSIQEASAAFFTADALTSGQVMCNGRPLKLSSNGTLPALPLAPVATPKAITLPAHSYGFIAARTDAALPCGA